MDPNATRSLSSALENTGGFTSEYSVSFSSATFVRLHRIVPSPVLTTDHSVHFFSVLLSICLAPPC